MDIRGRGQFFIQKHFFINKSIPVIEVAFKTQSIGFVWTQTTQELSKLKGGETFSIWNQAIYSKQEIPRKFKFWTLHFLISIEMKVNTKRYVKGSMHNFLWYFHYVWKSMTCNYLAFSKHPLFLGCQNIIQIIIKFHLVIALYYII